MATVQPSNQDLFAPPTEEEKGFFAPPTQAELGTVQTSTAPKQDMFAPPAPHELDDTGYETVKKTLERPFLDANWIGTEETTPSELDAIAKHYGVDSKRLTELAPMQGAVGVGSFAQEAGATLGRTAGFGIPQFAAKKLEDDPQMRAALDDVRELADKKRSLLQAGAEALVPGGAVAKIGKGVRGLALGGAATGAIYGTTGSREGSEVSGAATGAAVGGALGGVVGKVFGGASEKLAGAASDAEKRMAADLAGRAAPDAEEAIAKDLTQRAESERIIQDVITSERKMAPEEAERVLSEQLEPTQVQQRVEALGNLPAPEARLAVAEDLVRGRAKDLAEDLKVSSAGSLEDVQKSIIEHGARQGGQEYLKTRASQLAAEDAAKRWADATVLPNFGGGADIPRKILNTLSDAQFVGRTIDEKTGVGIEQSMQHATINYNKFSFIRKEAEQTLDALSKQTRAANISPQAPLPRVVQAIETGTVADLPDAEKAIAEQYQKFFANGRQMANEIEKRESGILPMSIPEREGYVPHMPLPPAEAVRAFERQTEVVLRDATELVGRPVQRLSELSPKEWEALMKKSEAAEELQRGLSHGTNNPIVGGVDAEKRLNFLTRSRGGRMALEGMANAAEAREGEIPSFLRDTNLPRVANRWFTNTFRHIYLRQPLDALRSKARILRKIGDETSAGYVERLIGDILGVRPGSPGAWMTERSIAFEAGLDRAAEKVGRDTVQGQAILLAKGIPDTLSWFSHQIYPNLLSWSPRALINNATQTFVKTAPEIGGPYGYWVVAKAALGARLNYKNSVRELEQWGLAPAAHRGVEKEYMAKGIQQTALVRVAKDKLEAASDLGMFLYSKLDEANRVVTLQAANAIAHDLGRGSEAAKAALAGFPRSVRKAVAAAQTPDELRRILATHLVNSTQYQYNRLAMNEFGRFMGPMFSTFSKWPAATAGEIASELQTKGAIKGSFRVAEKYVVPLLLLKGAGYMLHGPADDMTDVEKKLYGGKGLSQSAPIHSLDAFTQGDVFTPPVVDALAKGLFVPILSGDEPGLEKGLATTLQNFAPGSWLMRLLTDDLVTYYSGRRPEGNFVERTINGAQQLGK